VVAEERLRTALPSVVLMKLTMYCACIISHRVAMVAVLEAVKCGTCVRSARVRGAKTGSVFVEAPTVGGWIARKVRRWGSIV